jgi:EpsI family protein
VREQRLDADSLRVLEPDATLWRAYECPGADEGGRDDLGADRPPVQPSIDLLVVYGHRKKTFHSPAFCIPGGGYQVISKRQATLRLPVVEGRRGSAFDLPANAMVIQKGDRRLLVCYWYAQGGETTPGLARHTLRLLWRRVLHRPATGALVRVITPIGTDEAAGLRTASRFLAGSYPTLRQEFIRGARSRILVDRR